MLRKGQAMRVDVNAWIEHYNESLSHRVIPLEGMDVAIRALLAERERLQDALTETDCLHNMIKYLKRNGIEPVAGQELSQLWQFALSGIVEIEDGE